MTSRLGAACRNRIWGKGKAHSPPSHISKTVLSTVYVGGPKETRPRPRDGGGKDHRLPSHISNTVPSTVHVGPPPTIPPLPSIVPGTPWFVAARVLSGAQTCRMYPPVSRLKCGSHRGGLHGIVSDAGQSPQGTGTILRWRRPAPLHRQSGAQVLGPADADGISAWADFSP